MILVISTSLTPQSRSLALARGIVHEIQTAHDNVQLLDLASVTLPFCDGVKCYQDPLVHSLTAQVEDATGIILTSPIYNYDLNSAAKNFIELTGKGWENKVVGFACTAGGKSSYMAPLAFANSLMLDFRCLIIPRFVYATNDDFDAERQPDIPLRARLKQLADEVMALANRAN